MALACHTIKWRLQGNCSHRIRRRTATLEATFFGFLFHFSRFHPFTINVTRALPLEAIKGKAGAASRRDGMIKQQQPEHTVIETAHHHHHHPRDLGPAPSLESL
jgi:hypothetical protein